MGWRRNSSSSLTGERGVGLIELLVATAIMASVALVALSALSVGTRTLRQADSTATAHAIAATQIEFIKNQTYLPPPWTITYTTKVPEPPGYVVKAEAQSISAAEAPSIPGGDAVIEKIVVTVTFAGKTKAKLEAYRGIQ